MKKMYFILMFLFIFKAIPVNAEELVNNTRTKFDTNLKEISSVLNNDDVKFLIGVDNIINQPAISSWKVRSYCDKDMKIKLTASSTNDCGKAVKFTSFDKNLFSFLFDNKNNKSKNFYIKIKAYDAKGKWLHTEREGFRWK